MATYRIPRSWNQAKIRFDRLNYKAGQYATHGRYAKAIGIGVGVLATGALSYKGISFTAKSNRNRNKIYPKQLSTHPLNTRKPTSIKYGVAKIRGARAIPGTRIVPRLTRNNYPLLGYKKQGAFVHSLKKSGLSTIPYANRRRRPLTRGEYTAIRSGLSKQANAAYMHRTTFLWNKEFKAGRTQLHSVGYRRSYVRPLSHATFSHRTQRRYKRGAHGQFAGSY